MADSIEFKLNATSYTIKHGNRAAARELGINESMVWKWRKQDDDLRQVKNKQFGGNKVGWIDQWMTEDEHTFTKMGRLLRTPYATICIDH